MDPSIDTFSAMETKCKEKTLLSLPVELQIYILEQVKMTKDLVQARLACRHLNLLIMDIVKRRLRSDLTSNDGARCFIACNFRDPKWKEVGDLPRLSAVSMEQLEFVIEKPFIPRSLVSLVNTSAESDSEREHRPSSPLAEPANETLDHSTTNAFTDEFDCEMAIVLFSQDGGLKAVEPLYDGELRFRPRYDSPSRRGSLTNKATDPTTTDNNDIDHSTSVYLSTSGRELLSSENARAVLSGASRPEWEWRTDRSPSWIPCEARPLPSTDRQQGSIAIDNVRLEYQLIPKDIVDPSTTTSPTQVASSLSAATTSPSETLTMTVIGIEIKRLIVNTGQVLRFLHDQLPEVQQRRVVHMPGPILVPLPLQANIY